MVARKKAGRPSKVESEAKDEIIELLAAGNSLNVACDYVGIDKKTIFSWLDRGEAEESGPYRTFLHQFKKARATSQVSALARIRSGSIGWQGDAWFLERCFPKQYARRSEVGPITQTTLSDPPLEVVERSPASSALN